MSSRKEFDPRFSLPAVDDPPVAEVGVILMGLDAERLLAGLGLATIADDAALVTLVVDQARHDAAGPISLDSLIEAGLRRWARARPALAAASRGAAAPASLRPAWAHALAVLAASEVGEMGPATASYLAACWLRREDVDRRAGDRLAPGKGSFGVVSEVASS
jgi:hypothetical protein